MDKTLIRQHTRDILKQADEPARLTPGLQNLLQSLVDKEATKNYQKIIPSMGQCYGVPLPVLWVIASEVGKFFQKEPARAPEVLEVFWAEGSFEARQIAGKSLEKFGPKHPQVSLDFVTRAVPDLDNWSLCDSLAMYAVEPIVYVQPELVLPHSGEWIQSSEKWVRRFGVVTLRGYKRIKAGGQVFALLDRVMEDKDRDVRKAVAWILREMSKGNHDKVAGFLRRWAEAEPGRETRWIIEQGMKKLSDEDQNRIRESLTVGRKKASP